MKAWKIVALLALGYAVPALAETPTAAQKKSTVAWLQTLQKDSGGFAADAKASTPATLPATVAGLRALKYFGGEVPNKEAAARFVASCYDKLNTGYAPVPGGKADVRNTALGLLAVVELDLPQDKYAVKPVIYLCANVKAFEDIRIAAAAYEAVKSKCELSADWVASILKMQNPDGTYGKNRSVARTTASAAVTLLRLGAPVEHKDNILKALKAEQRPDGGWSANGDKSDLDTSYRVMRAFVMLKDRPDVPACRRFIASCRNADGSYSVRPGEPGNVSATYNAGIILHWLGEQWAVGSGQWCAAHCPLPTAHCPLLLARQLLQMDRSKGK